LIEVFNKLDKNGDGTISLEEFKEGITAVNSKTAKEIE